LEHVVMLGGPLALTSDVVAASTIETMDVSVPALMRQSRNLVLF
jgi:hypothetical protein